MKLNYTQSFSRLALLVLFFFLVFRSGAQSPNLQVSVSAPAGISECTSAPYVITVTNTSTTTAATGFSLTINFPGTPSYNYQQQFDLSSTPAAPSGYNLTATAAQLVYTVASTGSGIAPLGNVVFTYYVEGNGCIVYPGVSNPPDILTHQLAFTNTSDGTTYTGAVSYSATAGTVSTGGLISYNYNAVYIAPYSTSVITQSVTQGSGGSANFSASFTVLGSGAAYNGLISVNGGFCSGIVVNSLTMTVSGGSPLTITGPITFPYVFNCGGGSPDMSIPYNSTIVISENVSAPAGVCLPASCTNNLSLSWGCSAACPGSTGTGTGTLCQTTEQVPLILNITAASNAVNIYRLLPAPSPATVATGVTNEYPWESDCHGGTPIIGSEDHWVFLVQNNGTNKEYNIQMLLGSEVPSTVISETYVRQNSVHIYTGSTGNADPNLPNLITGSQIVTSGISTPVFTGITSAQLATDHAPTACYAAMVALGETPISKMTFDIAELDPGQAVEIVFNTYRCCASDNDPLANTNGLYYNHWLVSGNYQTPCQVGVLPYVSNDMIYPSAASVPVGCSGCTPMQGYVGRTSAGISAEYPTDYDISPDLALPQLFNPASLVLIGGTPSGPGTPEPYTITNVAFPSLENFDQNEMLYCPAGQAGGVGWGGAYGAEGVASVSSQALPNSNVQFYVDIYFDQSNAQVASVGGTTQLWIANGSTVWYPTTVTPLYTVGSSDPAIEQAWNTGTVTVTRAVFDLAHFPASSIGSIDDVKSFLTGSQTYFQLQSLCPIVGTPNPTIRILTSILPNMPAASCSGCGCSTCIIPIAEQAMKVELLCPGCKIPGMNIQSASFVRKNLGLVDGNNDRLPDSYTQIDNTYPQYNLVNTNGFVVNDVLESNTLGVIYAGGGTAGANDGGFSISDWAAEATANGWSNPTSSYSTSPVMNFSDFYLEQDVTNMRAAGLTCTSAKLYFTPVGYTSPITIPLANSVGSPPQIITCNGGFVFHAPKSLFPGGILALQGGEEFRVVADYIPTVNPGITTQVSVSDEMYLTLAPMVITPSDSLPFSGSGGNVEIQTVTGTSLDGATSANLAVPGDPYYFFCTGNATGMAEYPVFTYFSEFFTGANSCSNKLTVGVCNQIGNQYLPAGMSNPAVTNENLFPYEYRTTPGISLASLTDIVNGPLLNNAGCTATPILFTTIIQPTTGLHPGYTFKPLEVYTNIPYQPSPGTTLFLTALANPANILSDVTNPLNACTSSTTDWAVNLANVNFGLPYPSLTFTGGTNITSVNTTALAATPYSFELGTGTTDGLLIGDEVFSETVVFEKDVQCSTIETVNGNLHLVTADVPYEMVRGLPTTDIELGPTAGLPNTYWGENASYLVPPSINLPGTINYAMGGYPITSGSTLNNLIVVNVSTTTPYADYLNINGVVSSIPNMYFYINLTANPLPAGVTLGNFIATGSAGSLTGTVIPPIYFYSGSDYYVGYDIPNNTTGVSQPGSGNGYYNLQLNVTSCVAEGEVVTLPVYYAWDCTSFPSGLPSPDNCSPIFSASATYTIPNIRLGTPTLNVAYPTGFTGVSVCEPFTVTAALTSSDLGGVGNLTYTLNLPAGLSIYGTATLSTNHHSVNVTGAFSTLTSTGSPITISLSPYTALGADFTTSPPNDILADLDGLTNDDGPLVLTFQVIPYCGYVFPTTINSTTFGISMSMVGTSYCSSTAGDVSLNFTPDPWALAVNSVPNSCTTPAATISATSTSICSGTSTTLTAASGGTGATYSWSSNAGTQTIAGIATYPTNSSSASMTVTPVISTSTSTTTTYTVTVTNSALCSASGSITVTINPVPSLPAQTTTVCSHGAFSYTPTGSIVPSGTTYKWSAPSESSGITGGVSATGQTTLNGTLTNSHTTAGTATYTVTPTSGTCTGTPFTVTVTVNPAAIISSQSTSVCSGFPLSYTPTGTIPSGTTYAWSTPTMASGISGGTSASGQSNINGTLSNGNSTAATATYSVTASTGSCTATFNVTVTVNPIPTPTLSASPALCTSGSSSTEVLTSGNHATLAAAGGTTYAWSPATGLSSTTISDPVASPTTTTTYTVTVTKSSCTATTAVTVDVPTIASTPLCTGSNETISVTPAGSSYVWSSNAGSATTQSVTVSAAGTYTVTTTYSPGTTACKATASTTIVVNTPPTVYSVAPSSGSFCAGGTGIVISLSNSQVGINYQLYNGSTASGSPVSGTGSGISFPAQTAAGTYTVVATNATTNCQSTMTGLTVVTVNPIPTPSITGSASGCNSVSLTATGGDTYAWSGGSTPGTAANTFTSSGNYTVTVSYAATGCSATTSAAVTINPLPTVGPITGTTSICLGSTTTLSDATTGGSWSSSNTAIATISSGGILTAVSAGNTTVSYSYTDVNGCTNAATATVTVNALPAVAAITGTTTVCMGSTTTLSDATMGGSWSSSNTAVATISSGGVVTPVSAGTTTMSYSYTDENGCQGSASVTVTVDAISLDGAIPYPICSGLVLNGDSISLAASGGVPGYTYSVDGATLPSAMYVATASGTYTASVVDADGCSASLTITVPSTFVFGTLTATASCADDGTATISIPSGSGYFGFEWSTGAGGTGTLEIDNLSPGVYSVTVGGWDKCSETFDVIVPSLISVGFNTPCLTTTDGATTTITPTISGGTAPYSYNWSTTTGANIIDGSSYVTTASSTSISIAYLIALGTSTFTYDLTVTDANGCTATGAITIVAVSACKNGGTMVPPSQSSSADAMPAVNGLTLIPNPAIDQVSIGFTLSEAAANPKIIIYDVLGKVIKQILFSVKKGTFVIDISGYAPGTYSVVLQNNSHELLTKRLVKE